MFDVKLFECFSSYLNHLPPFALAMMDAQPLISKICVCRTKDVTSDAGSCTFEDGRLGTLLISTAMGAAFIAARQLTFWVNSKKANEQIAEYLNWNETKETLPIYYGPRS